MEEEPTSRRRRRDHTFHAAGSTCRSSSAGTSPAAAPAPRKGLYLSSPTSRPPAANWLSARVAIGEGFTRRRRACRFTPTLYSVSAGTRPPQRPDPKAADTAPTRRSRIRDGQRVGCSSEITARLPATRGDPSEPPSPRKANSRPRSARPTPRMASREADRRNPMRMAD